jgi:hypothetical protein
LFISERFGGPQVRDVTNAAMFLYKNFLSEIIWKGHELTSMKLKLAQPWFVFPVWIGGILLWGHWLENHHKRN